MAELGGEERGSTLVRLLKSEVSLKLLPLLPCMT